MMGVIRNSMKITVPLTKEDFVSDQFLNGVLVAATTAFKCSCQSFPEIGYKRKLRGSFGYWLFIVFLIM